MSSNDPPTPAALKVRLQQAIDVFRNEASPDQQNTLALMLDQAHDQATDLVTGASDSSPTHHILANVRSLLENTSALPEPGGGLAVSTVSEEGDLVGTQQYEALDLRWAESAACWLAHFPPDQKAKFPNNPPTIQIDNQVTIAVVGDWGTGVGYRTDDQIDPAQKVANAVKQLDPDYTVHLGDVYYSGTQDQENTNFLGVWRSGKKGTFTLNSNHEMYSGALGYFLTTLADPRFSAQNGSSYFVLQNDYWLVIALDTAFYADEMGLYQHGHLDPTQCAFLSNLAANAGTRQILLLTHHNGLSVDGGTQSALWQQIAPLLAPRNVWWYWGHLHAGVVYSQQANMRGRCCGHGAVPCGAPQGLDENPAVLWYENTPVVDLLYQGRVHNGFALLSLNNATLTETFVNEDGLNVYSG
jgi:hypothetical protein